MLCYPGFEGFASFSNIFGIASLVWKLAQHIYLYLRKGFHTFAYLLSYGKQPFILSYSMIVSVPESDWFFRHMKIMDAKLPCQLAMLESSLPCQTSLCQLKRLNHHHSVRKTDFFQIFLCSFVTSLTIACSSFYVFYFKESTGRPREAAAPSKRRHCA